jgi:hypothetical protein
MAAIMRHEKDRICMTGATNVDSVVELLKG